MATIWEMLKESWQASKLAEKQEHQKENPLDRDIPLEIRVNGSIEIHAYLTEELNEQFPHGNYLVEAFSAFELNGIKGYKVFLVAESDETPSYLWIQSDKKGPVIRWFKNIDTVYPPSPEEWAFWIAETDGQIGLQQFQTREGVLYDRLWDCAHEFRIKPVEYHEMHYPDKFDPELAYPINNHAMFYFREIESKTSAPVLEYCLLTHEQIPQNKGDDAESIKIDLGVDVLASQIKVNY